MDEIEELRLLDEDGNPVIADVLLNFKLKNDPVPYIIYTLNEVDENGLLTLLVSRIEMLEEGVARLHAIEDEEKWKQIKRIMRNIIKKGGEV